MVLQCLLRAAAARATLQVLRAQQHAATTIQAAWRAVSQQRYYTQLRIATLTLQTAWRARQQRVAYREMRSRVVLVQAAVRGYLQRSRWAHTLSHTDACEHAPPHTHTHTLCVPASSATPRHARLRHSVLIVQSAWRGRCIRRQLHLAHLHRSAVTIQSMVRGHQVGNWGGEQAHVG